MKEIKIKDNASIFRDVLMNRETSDALDVANYLFLYGGRRTGKSYNRIFFDEAYGESPVLSSLRFANDKARFKSKYDVKFNNKKKSVTLLEFDNDSSDMYKDKKTTVKTCKGDRYNRKIGFLLAYFQHTSCMSKTQANQYLKELLEEKK